MTKALLAAALEYAAQHGVTIVEGYPVDKPEGAATPDMYAYPGIASTFRALGFVKAARRSPTRPVMRRPEGGGWHGTMVAETERPQRAEVGSLRPLCWRGGACYSEGRRSEARTRRPSMVPGTSGGGYHTRPTSRREPGGGTIPALRVAVSPANIPTGDWCLALTEVARRAACRAPRRTRAAELRSRRRRRLAEPASHTSP